MNLSAETSFSAQFPLRTINPILEFAGTSIVAILPKSSEEVKARPAPSLPSSQTQISQRSFRQNDTAQAERHRYDQLRHYVGQQVLEYLTERR